MWDARGRDGRFLPAYAFDPLDPRGWELDLPYRRLQLSDRDDSLFCILDREDWEWASQWPWRYSENSWGKPYACRSVVAPDGRKVNLFLHKEILARFASPASALHCIGDHKNGRSLDNRRWNLRWATPDQNNRNRYGFYAYQLQLGFAL